MISKSRIQGPVHELDSMVVGELLDDQWFHASQKFRGRNFEKSTKMRYNIEGSLER